MNEYAILESNSGMTLEEIKKNFRRLAHKHHPDKGGSEAKMKQITVAWTWMQANHRQTSAQSSSSKQYGPGNWGYRNPSTATEAAHDFYASYRSHTEEMRRQQSQENMAYNDMLERMKKDIDRKSAAAMERMQREWAQTVHAGMNVKSMGEIEFFQFFDTIGKNHIHIRFNPVEEWRPLMVTDRPVHHDLLMEFAKVGSTEKDIKEMIKKIEAARKMMGL